MCVNKLSQGQSVDLPKAGLEPRTSRSESRASTTRPRRHEPQSAMLVKQTSQPTKISQPSDEGRTAETHQSLQITKFSLKRAYHAASPSSDVSVSYWSDDRLRRTPDCMHNKHVPVIRVSLELQQPQVYAYAC
ncbi:hypothetical protein ElyMa_001356000 [Elysia marginata]|uniref:Uncharacterized protein n=1 Tax=Elysia marginata TaxID=1093978 RepID=A0AAV4INV3_9GAST|nr:hypothetical protein ElyMa_001356000 [Elysia marginata]